MRIAKYALGATLLVGSLISCKENKTAFVNNTKVVSEYKEMKDAEAKWTKKNDELRMELQQKAMEFQKEVQAFEAERASLSKNKFEESAGMLQQKQQALQREQQTRVQEIQQLSGAEIDTIVNKVKKFIKDYGKKNGYTYIYGDTETSNILYGKEELNITDEIIAELNKNTTSEPNTTMDAKEQESTEIQEATPLGDSTDMK